MSKLNYNSLKILNKYNENKLDLSVFGDQNKLNDSLQAIDVAYDEKSEQYNELYDRTSKVSDISITENQTVKASDNNLYGYTKVQVNVSQGFVEGGEIPTLGRMPLLQTDCVRLSTQFTTNIPKFKLYNLNRREIIMGTAGCLMLDTTKYQFIPAGNYDLLVIVPTVGLFNFRTRKIGDLIADETQYTVTIDNTAVIGNGAILGVNIDGLIYIFASSDIGDISIDVTGTDLKTSFTGCVATYDKIDLTYAVRGDFDILKFITGLTFVKSGNSYTFSTRPVGIVGG